MRSSSIRIFSSLAILALFTTQTFSQVPQGFSYQAVIRDGSGVPITEKTIGMRITLQDATGKALYAETLSSTTNKQGIISIIIGAGNQVSDSSFTCIPWKTGDVLIKVEIDPNGTNSYTQMGDPTKLMAVPYALYADNTKEITSRSNATDDEPIFVVKNKAGKIVFAVYQTGVRIYVEDTPTIKGAKGGFAVGGLSNQAKGNVEYLRITSDSARIFVNEISGIKGAKGGFAVGGLSNLSKAANHNLMFVGTDSTRFYINDTIAPKGAKGGFAVGGLSNLSKGSRRNEFLRISKDSARIYVDQSSNKGAKGGFAVGGLSNLSKGGGSKYLDLTPNNYFIGHEAGKLNTVGLYNSFIGYQSGLNNTSGTKNYFIGYRTGFNNTTGYSNIFVGDSAGFANKSGYRNVFIGNQSGKNNTIGGNNTACGLMSMINNTTGSNNTAYGYLSLTSNTTSNGNTALGWGSLFTLSSGNGNTAVGTMALSVTTTATNNTALGLYTFLSSDPSITNSTAIGAMAQVTTSNQVVIGGTGVTQIGGPVGWSVVSDGRFKNITKADVKGLDFITRLSPVMYTFDTQKYDEFLMQNMSLSMKNEIMSKKDYSESKAILRSGFVAQDVVKAAKEVGYDFNGVHHPVNENDNYSIDYSLLTVPLVKAVQELNAKNQDLQKQVDTLKAELEAIKALLKK
jgi:hypothetical protein